MLKVLTSNEFKQSRREKLLDYSSYKKEAEDLAMRIPRTTQRLTDQEWMSKKTAAEAKNMTRGRAQYSANLLTLSYSAGAEIEDLRAFYPTTMDHWDEFANYAKAYVNSSEYEGSWVAHFALLGDAYEMVNRMACFGILFGFPTSLSQLAAIIDYRNPKMDGLLERLFAPFVPGRPPAPDECTRHLPYFKTLKIFKAAKEERPSLMAEYLSEWYEASRRESYFESHTRENFQGYWSWEAAAITFILDIDDTTYRDANFYPSDLVDFARRLDASMGDLQTTETSGMRVEGGKACPKAGYWTTPAEQDSRHLFNVGEIMPTFEHSAYGATIWQWSDQQ